MLQNFLAKDTQHKVVFNDNENKSIWEAFSVEWYVNEDYLWGKKKKGTTKEYAALI